MRAFTKKRNKYGEEGDDLTENMSLLGSSGIQHRRMEEEEYGTEYEGNIFTQNFYIWGQEQTLNYFMMIQNVILLKYIKFDYYQDKLSIVISY